MVSGARNLHTLRLGVYWIPYASHVIKVGKETLLPNAPLAHVEYQQGTAFTLENAVNMMLTPENPKLRTIGIGRHQFVVSTLQFRVALVLNFDWILSHRENGFL